MNIGEQLSYTTTRIEAEVVGGTSVGTGFFFKHNDQVFLVTNKHVIENMIRCKFAVLNSEKIDEEFVPRLGQLIEFTFDAEESDFKGHPNEDVDITVSNVTKLYLDAINAGMQPYIKWIAEEHIPNQEFIDKFISPVEDILFVGYPSGIWDTINGLPIIRKGITATPYYVNFEGKSNFLIDASVFNGSSGSPVFMYYSGSYSDKNGELYAGNMLKFLGIIARSYYRSEEGKMIIKDIPTKETQIPVANQMIDLGVVFNSTMVLETINYYLGGKN